MCKKMHDTLLILILDDSENDLSEYGQETDDNVVAMVTRRRQQFKSGLSKMSAVATWKLAPSAKKKISVAPDLVRK